MATDLAEFVGAALGLHLVFWLPLLAVGAITAVVAFVILALEQRGYPPLRTGDHRPCWRWSELGFVSCFSLVGGQDTARSPRGLRPAAWAAATA